MSFENFIRLLEVGLWPIVAIVAIFVVRPHLRVLLSSAKVKLSVAGQSIETTLPELKQVIEEQTGVPLSGEQEQYLSLLQSKGGVAYPEGIRTEEQQVFVRPLRNSGLVVTVPRNVFLVEARAVELSGLGRLYLRAKELRGNNVT